MLIQEIDPILELSMCHYAYRCFGVLLSRLFCVITMAHRKQGYHFENDWTMEHMETRTFQNYEAEAAVSANVEMEAEQHVLNNVKLGEKMSTMFAVYNPKQDVCADNVLGGCI
jgi:hypothetical protein